MIRDLCSAVVEEGAARVSEQCVGIDLQVVQYFI